MRGTEAPPAEVAVALSVAVGLSAEVAVALPSGGSGFACHAYTVVCAQGSAHCGGPASAAGG